MSFASIPIRSATISVIPGGIAIIIAQSGARL